MAKKSARQLDAEIAQVLGRPRSRAGARKKVKKSSFEAREARLKDRLTTLRDVMADVVGDNGWLEADPYEIEKWISVDEDLSDREWLAAAKDQLVEQSVAPEHAGAPPERVRRWNDAFISTYNMNIDSGMSEQEAIDSARDNAYDTVRLAPNEHGLIKIDPKLYTTKRRRYS